MGEHSTALSTLLAGTEAVMLAMPQAECPVFHRFGPGVYIREMLIPAGTLILGHAHRHDHINVMLAGTFALVNDDQTVTVLKAPQFFIGRAGRKIGYAIEDTVWQNIFATEERDLDRLEAMFVEKSDAYLQHECAEALTHDTPDDDLCVCIEYDGEQQEAPSWLGLLQQ